MSKSLYKLALFRWVWPWCASRCQILANTQSWPVNMSPLPEHPKKSTAPQVAENSTGNLNESSIIYNTTADGTTEEEDGGKVLTWRTSDDPAVKLITAGSLMSSIRLFTNVCLCIFKLCAISFACYRMFIVHLLEWDRVFIWTKYPPALCVLMFNAYDVLRIIFACTHVFIFYYLKYVVHHMWPFLSYLNNDAAICCCFFGI